MTAQDLSLAPYGRSCQRPTESIAPGRTLCLDPGDPFILIDSGESGFFVELDAWALARTDDIRTIAVQASPRRSSLSELAHHPPLCHYLGVRPQDSRDELDRLG